jgi:hypothetical protein
MSMFSEESIRKVFEIMLVQYQFELPMSWAIIGVNGTFLTGKFEASITGQFRSTVLSGKANRLRFPINCLFVDRKGKAALVAFSKSSEIGKVTPSFAAKNYN